MGRLAFKDNSDLVDVLLNEREMSLNASASNDDVFEEVKGSTDRAEAA